MEHSTGAAPGLAPLAASIVAALSLAAALPAAAAQGDEASDRFEKGVSLYKAGKLDAALAEFQAAYDLSPTFEVLYNIAKLYSDLGRFADSLHAWEKYLAEGGDAVPAAKLAEAQSAMQKLDGLVAKVTVTCNVEGAQLFVDGEPVARMPMEEPVYVDAGIRVIEVRASGWMPEKHEIVLAGGTSRIEDFVLAPGGSGPAAGGVAPDGRPVISFDEALGKASMDPAFLEKASALRLAPVYKKPAVAWALGFLTLPGAGMYYVGGRRNLILGISQTGIAALGAVMVIAAIVLWYAADAGVGPTAGLAAAGGAVFAAGWLWSGIHAPVAAVKHDRALDDLLSEHYSSSWYLVH